MPVNGAAPDATDIVHKHRRNPFLKFIGFSTTRSTTRREGYETGANCSQAEQFELCLLAKTKVMGETTAQ